MRQIILTFFLLSSILLSSCGNKTDHAHHEDLPSDGSTNDVLYNEVMEIHDEVMPKMNDIYRIKEELKKQLAESTQLPEEERKNLEEKLARLEEAGESMMVWMREFNPPADSLGEEVVRTYLETQLESVKKVRENINEVLPK